MYLIGFNGLRQSGKSTAFECLAEVAAKRGQRATEHAHADALKVFMAKSLGLEGDAKGLIGLMDYFKEYGSLEYSVVNDEGDTLETETLSGRQFQQNMGNKAREVFGDDFWVDQVTPLDVEKFSKIWLDHTGRWPDWGCLTGVRYPNEAWRIHELGGMIVEIVRPGIESDGHVTEQALPEGVVDYTIKNDGSLLSLKAKIIQLMDKIEDGVIRRPEAVLS